MQHEITAAQPLLDEKGNLREAGYCKKLLPIYRRRDIKAGALRIKEWDYYLVNNGHFAVALTIADNGYMGLDSISLLNLDEGWEKTKSPMRAFPLGKTGLPESSETGDVSISGKGYHLSFRHDGPDRVLDFHMEDFLDGAAIDGRLRLTDEPATEKELRTLHKTIRKVTEDIENFSFNTSVAAFMICLNELGDCSKRAVLEPLVVLLAPFAPHIAEELWAQAGHTTSVCDATYPVCEEKYLVQSAFEYPVSVNGKLRFKKEYATTMTPAEIQAAVVTAPEAQKWLDGKAPKKVIVVPGKIINIVI